MKKSLMVALAMVLVGEMSFCGRVCGDGEPVTYPSGGASAFCGVHLGVAVGLSSNSGAMQASSSNILFETLEEGLMPSFYQSGTAIAAPPYAPEQPGFITTDFQIGSGGMIHGGWDTQWLVDIRAGYYGLWSKSSLCGVELRYLFMPQKLNFSTMLSGNTLTTKVEIDPVSPGVNFGATSVANNDGFYNGISLSSAGSPEKPVDFGLFQYKVTGDLDFSIQSGSTLEAVLSLGHSFTSNSAIFFKIGAAVGFWHLEGNANITADCDAYWPISYPPILNSSGSVVGEFVSKSYAYGDEDTGLDAEISFSQGKTFVGIIFVPTMNFKITESIMSFAEVKISYYPGRSFALDLSEYDMGDNSSMNVELRGLNNVGVFLGLTCILGNSEE